MEHHDISACGNVEHIYGPLVPEQQALLNQQQPGAARITGDLKGIGDSYDRAHLAGEHTQFASERRVADVCMPSPRFC